MSQNLAEPFLRMLAILQSGLLLDADEHTLSSKLDAIQVALVCKTSFLNNIRTYIGQDTVDNIVRVAAQPVCDGLATLSTRLWTKVARDSYPCLRESPQSDFQTRYAEAFAAQFRHRHEQPTRFIEASQQTDFVAASPPRLSIDVRPSPCHSVHTPTPEDSDPTHHQEHRPTVPSGDSEPPYTQEEEDTDRGYLDIVFGSAGPPHPRAGETVG
ncbi:hypothetical protein EIP86_010973 [Pleurotus ostreatoroseus]|nr:hypothetical protein EIP86_010973 [Pleurotus ostreatoroseus]